MLRLNRLQKIDVKMNDMMKCIHALGIHASRKDNDEDADHDNDSQSSLNHTNMMDFFQGAGK